MGKSENIRKIAKLDFGHSTIDDIGSMVILMKADMSCSFYRNPVVSWSKDQKSRAGVTSMLFVFLVPLAYRVHTQYPKALDPGAQAQTNGRATCGCRFWAERRRVKLWHVWMVFILCYVKTHCNSTRTLITFTNVLILLATAAMGQMRSKVR